MDTVFTGIASLILGVVVYATVQMVKSFAPDWWEKPWPNRFLNVLPILIGFGYSMIPGWKGVLPSTFTLTIVGFWGAAVGFLSSLVYKYVRRALGGLEDRKRPDDKDKEDSEKMGP